MDRRRVSISGRKTGTSKGKSKSERRIQRKKEKEAKRELELEQKQLMQLFLKGKTTLYDSRSRSISMPSEPFESIVLRPHPRRCCSCCARCPDTTVIGTAVPSRSRSPNRIRSIASSRNRTPTAERNDLRALKEEDVAPIAVYCPNCKNVFNVQVEGLPIESPDDTLFDREAEIWRKEMGQVVQ